jgi:hypothetical protein
MDRKLASILIMSTLLLPLTSASADGSGDTSDALGRLTVRATADVGTSSDQITVTDGTHPYFAGERIAVRPEGQVVLTLPDGAVVLGPESVMRVDRGASGWRIDLEGGAVRARFEGSAAFEIIAGGVRLHPRAGETAEEIETLIVLDELRGISVTARSGSIEGTRADGAPGLLIPEGETKIYAISGQPEMADVAAMKERPPRWWVKPAAGVGAVAVAGGGAYLVEEELDDDDDDDVTSAVK